MPRAVIADSDDEDNILSPPRNSLSPINLEAGGNRSSDHISHDTNSTDPAFFQNIYDEQNNPTELPERERLTSSEMTAPADFVPTKTGLVDPSSLTSVTDPLVAKEGKSSSDKRMSDWTQVSTPGRKKAPIARMEDPWDVPSSPEENRQPTRKIKIRLRRSGNRAAPETVARPNAAPIEVGKGSHGLPRTEAHDSDQRDIVDNPDGRRKRRKVASLDTSQEAYNEVDLVTIPFTHEDDATQRNTQRPIDENEATQRNTQRPIDENEATQRNTQRPTQTDAMSSMLPPTLPVENETSFFVQPNGLSNSQKMEYQSVHLDSSGHNEHDTLLPLPHFDTQVHASSGLATNINTPRSDLPYVSQGPPQPSEPPASLMSRPKRSSRLRRNSSPDIISTGETPAKRRRTLRNTEAIPDTTPIIEEVLDVPEKKAEEIQHEDDSKTNNVQANHDESDYAPEAVKQPIKTKKTRGRPKKVANTQATQTTPAVKSPAGDGEPGARQKKRRGRPRKSDQVAAVEKSPQVETISSEGVAHIQKSESKEDFESGTHSRVDETSHKQEDLEGSTGTKVEARTVPAPGTGNELEEKLKEISDNAVTVPSLKKSETASSKDSGSRTTMSEKAGTSDAKKTPDQKKPAIKGLTSMSKPIYRVGLSKKSRIAPLLKSLRK